ncbi:MAG: hypothetical protein WAV20_09905 [Blastocatellia bacterium]
MRVRAIAGLVGGALLVLSSAAHAFLGWPPQSALFSNKPVSMKN